MSLYNFDDIKSGNSINWETLITYLNATLNTYDFAKIVANDGWISDTNTWTYASAGANYGTFTISGNVTSIFTVGLKLKYTNSSLKYGVVTSSTYSAPNTTIKVQGGTDYILANAAISSPKYSFADQPNDFPSAFYDTSLTPTGFSAQGTYYNRFTTKGRLCYLWHHYTALGTSNATTYTVPLPITAATKLISYLGRGTGTDNTSSYQNNVLFTVSSGGSSVSIEPNGGASAWTASGTRGANGSVIYEF